MTATFGRSGTFKGWDKFDYVLVLAALALVVYGVILIYSGSIATNTASLTSFASPVAKQIIFAILGVIGMLIISKIDYHYFVHYAWYLYGFGILSLIVVLFIGTTVGGSTRWFDLGIVQLQPSEFAKLATIFALARFFSERDGDAREVRALFYSLAVVAPNAALVFIEPDLGTSIMFLAIWLGIVMVAGVSRRHLLILIATFFAILPFAWTFALADYQVDRVAILVDPNEDPLGAGYNVNQSRIAVGSGGLFGKGLLEGEQTNLGYLKVPTKDFIFSVLGEELGFFGAMVMFGLFGLLLFRGIRAAEIAGDTAGQLIAVGIVLLILAQTFINVAVNVSLFPVTGIPLPFMSQGGSSLVSLFASLGVLQSIIMRHRAYRQA